MTRTARRWLTCTTEDHEALKLDEAAWARAVENERPWHVGGKVLMLAECKGCGSTLCRRSPAPLVAASPPAA